MRYISLSEFKGRTKEFLAAIVAGEEIVLTRDGSDVAKVLPSPKTLARAEDRRRRRGAAVESLTAIREELRTRGVRVTSEEVKAWIEDGRR